MDHFCSIPGRFCSISVFQLASISFGLKMKNKVHLISVCFSIVSNAIFVIPEAMVIMKFEGSSMHNETVIYVM